METNAFRHGALTIILRGPRDRLAGLHAYNAGERVNLLLTAAGTNLGDLLIGVRPATAFMRYVRSVPPNGGCSKSPVMDLLCCASFVKRVP